MPCSYVGFESPESVERKIESLDGLWEALARNYPKDENVQLETKRFRAWRDKVKKTLTSYFFPSTIADEYEQWQARYRIAFNKARNQAPNVKVTAPTPDAAFGPLPKPSPWIYAIVTGSVALGLLAIAWMKK